MGEPEAQGHPNGDASLDHPMDVHTSVVNSDPSATSSSNTIDSNAVSTSYTTPLDCPNDDDVQPPPAKRPRMHSDADEASLANVSPPCPVRLSRRANVKSKSRQLHPQHLPCPRCILTESLPLMAMALLHRLSVDRRPLALPNFAFASQQFVL
jgi:hypothetical protein